MVSTNESIYSVWRFDLNVWSLCMSDTVFCLFCVDFGHFGNWVHAVSSIP